MPRLCNRCHRLGVGLRPELPVPLSLPLWRIDGAMASPLKIRRDATLCIDCGKCAKACPSIPPVDKLIPSNPPNAWAVCSAWPFALRMARYSCRSSREKSAGLGDRRRFGGTVLRQLFDSPCDRPLDYGLPDRIYRNLVPRANEFGHPRTTLERLK